MRLLADQRRRLVGLEAQQAKLLDAYMADAIPVDLLKQRQTALSGEIADAKRLIAEAQSLGDQLSDRLKHVLALLHRAGSLYETAADEDRRLLNEAVFEAMFIDSQGPLTGDAPVVEEAPLSPIVQAVVTAAPPGNAGTPVGRNADEGSNVTQLAVAEGFEPSVDLRPQTLSRRSP